MGLPTFFFSAELSVAICGEEKNRIGLKFYRAILRDILHVEVKNLQVGSKK